MNIPETDEEGRFDGALLFDGRAYRTPAGIVDFRHYSDRLGIVRDKKAYFLAEFLGKHHAAWTTLPLWDESRSSMICQSEEEALRHIEEWIADLKDGEAQPGGGEVRG